MKIVFEDKKWSVIEGIIMWLYRIKAARLGISVPVFSHVWLHYNGLNITTHPGKGVNVVRSSELQQYEYRTVINYIPEINLNNRLFRIIKEQGTGYSRWAAFCSGVYTLTNIWIGSKKYKRPTCSQNVAYLLGIPKFWKADILDIWIYVNRN